MKTILAFLRAHAGFVVCVVLLFIAAGVAIVLLREMTGVGAAPEFLGRLHWTFNLVEGFVWLSAGAIVLVRRLYSPSAVRSPLLVAGVAFLAFGPTDFVEMRTGAWYEPWWLFAWKATCVVALLGSYLGYARRRQFIEPPSAGARLGNSKVESKVP